MGENPIKETIKLKESDKGRSYLQLKTDGTALGIYCDDDEEETEAKFKYTYDDENRTITMKLEKTVLELDFEGNQGQLMTYSEIRSKINEEVTVEKMRQSEKEYYEERKDGEWFKEDYPNCNSYEDYEAAILKMEGYSSFDAYVKDIKQEMEEYYKSWFGAKITYAYKTDGGKMTLTQKFTGLKNMVHGECRFYDKLSDSDVRIMFDRVDIEENDNRYRGTLNTDNKTIDFESRKDHSTYEATYTEDIAKDIAKGTVTIKFEGKEYVCKFEGEKYIQAE